MNIVVGTVLGIGSGSYLFHDIFGPNAEHLLEWNRKLKEEALQKERGQQQKTQNDKQKEESGKPSDSESSHN